MEKKQRYYLHGDQTEHDCDKYYCRSCDFFVDRSHFADHDSDPSRMSNYPKYLATLKSWQVIKKRSKNLYRPNNAINLFE